MVFQSWIEIRDAGFVNEMLCNGYTVADSVVFDMGSISAPQVEGWK